MRVRWMCEVDVDAKKDGALPEGSSVREGARHEAVGVWVFHKASEYESG